MDETDIGMYDGTKEGHSLAATPWGVKPIAERIGETIAGKIITAVVLAMAAAGTGFAATHPVAFI